jgi:hypothetical protein
MERSGRFSKSFRRKPTEVFGGVEEDQGDNFWGDLNIVEGNRRK